MVDRRPRRWRRRRPRPPSIGGTDVAVGVAGRRHRRGRRRSAAVDETLLAFGGVDLVVNNAGLSLSKSLLETTEADWDLQHDVMAKGSFLVSRDRREGADRAGARRRHRLHLQQELGLRRARTTSPTPRPRPTRPTRCGCWPPSSASTASGSTGSTPTASSRAPASSPAAGAPTAPRSTAWRRRTSASSTPSAPCSSARCCPSTSPTPSYALVGPDLTHTTGLHIPVDAGVAAAFLAVARDAGPRRRGRPRRLQRPGHRSARSGRDRLRARGGRPVRQRPGAHRPTGCTGTSSGSTTHALGGLRGGRRARARSRWPASPSTRGPSTTACCATAGCSDSRSTTATSGTRSRRRHACTRRCRHEELYAPQRPAVPAVQHRSTSSPPTRCVARRRTRLLLIPDLLGLLAHRARGHRAHQRLHDRAARRAHAGVGPRAARPPRPARRSCSPSWSTPARPSAPLPPGGRRATRRRPASRVTAVGSHDTASAVVGVPMAERRRGVHLLRHLGAGRRRARHAGPDRRQPGRRTSPTRAASTAGSASSPT